MNTSYKVPSASAVAREFSKILTRWLGRTRIVAINRRNAKKEIGDTGCASQLYCDANVAMDDAFEAVMGIKATETPTGYSTMCMADDIHEVWQEAWALAAVNGFDAAKIQDQPAVSTVDGWTLCNGIVRDEDNEVVINVALGVFGTEVDPILLGRKISAIPHLMALAGHIKSATRLDDGGLTVEDVDRLVEMAGEASAKAGVL